MEISSRQTTRISCEEQLTSRGFCRPKLDKCNVVAVRSNDTRRVRTLDSIEVGRWGHIHSRQSVSIPSHGTRPAPGEARSLGLDRTSRGGPSTDSRPPGLDAHTSGVLLRNEAMARQSLLCRRGTVAAPRSSGKGWGPRHFASLVTSHSLACGSRRHRRKQVPTSLASLRLARLRACRPHLRGRPRDLRCGCGADAVRSP